VHWRAAHPELVERFEQLEQELAAIEDPNAAATAPPADMSSSRGRGAEPAAGRSTGGERAARGPRAPQRQTAEEPRAPLDLNHATLADLTRLPGVGPVLARRILDTRDTLDRFGSVEDLVRVRGFGRARLERLRPFINVLE
jgi:competence protein ComEA